MKSNILIICGAILFILTNILILNLAVEEEYCASKIFQFEKCKGK